jgi:hypothetical protein
MNDAQKKKASAKHTADKNEVPPNHQKTFHSRDIRKFGGVLISGDRNGR